jgi:hypothetical protein
MKIIINGSIQSSTSRDSAQIYRVYQVNAFSNYQPVYFSGAVWALAQANALNTMGTHIIMNVTSTGFDVVQSGKISALAHGLGSAGDWLYVSEAVAGDLTAVPPTIYTNALIQVIDDNTLEVFPYQASKISPDLPDPITLNVRTTTPTVPGAGLTNLYVKTKYGSDVPYTQDVFGIEKALQTALWQKDIYMILPVVSTTLMKFGGDVTNNGTISHDATTGEWSQITAASANAVAGLYFAVAHFSGVKGYHFYADLTFPDADYGVGATGFRAIVGLSAVALGTSAGSDNHASERAYFAISSNLTESEWMFSTRDSGGTERRVSTGIAFVATHRYRFFIMFPPGGTTIYYRIDDVTDSTTSGELSNTLNLPTNASALFAGHHICTLTTTARIVRGKKTYVESLLGL